MSKNKPDMVHSEYYAPFMAGGRKGNYNNPTNNAQALTERMYMRVLTEMSCNRFKWVGLPDSIDERFMELELFRAALVVFYRDHTYGRYLALRASGSGRTNMYDNPTSFTVTGGLMINKTLGPKQCVPIWSNYLRVPDMDIVVLYSRKLAAIDRTIEINSLNMRQQKIILAEEHERHSMLNILRQMEEGVPAILGTKALDMSNIQVLDLGVHPETLPKLMVAKSKMWNECMTLLGINNSNQDKAERLVADEVSANDQQIRAARSISMNAREQSAAQINERYGLHVSVRFNLEGIVAPPQVMYAPDYSEDVE